MTMQPTHKSGCVDPFLKASPYPEGWARRTRRARPQPLQYVLDTLSSVLRSSEIALSAEFDGHSILKSLSIPGAVRAPGKRVTSVSLRSEVVDCLRNLAAGSSEHEVLALGLERVIDDVDWYVGSAGPFASANFEGSHAHAILVGAGGIEERPDVRVGLTVMAPYTRFPDHRLPEARVIMALSPGEFRTENGEWRSEPTGSVLGYSAGREFAMRCTGRPLLVLWWQKPRA